MLLHFKRQTASRDDKQQLHAFAEEMTLSPVTTLLLGVILGCAVTTLIHSLTVSCVQCASSRSLAGLDKSSVHASSDRFRFRQLGMISSETSCTTLRLRLETMKAMSPTTNRRRKRSADNVKGIVFKCDYNMLPQVSIISMVSCIS